ncbi:MAG: DNA repair and recombination protein RadA [Candidatus Thorarchaeota archaeon]
MRSLEDVEGVGPAVARKLKAAFITTAELLAVQNPVELQVKAGIGEGTAKKIVSNARRLVGLHGFRSGLEVERVMVEEPKLTTGIASVDEALLGGIECGSIVEFYGPARGGKTQWCTHLAVRVQLPPGQGGLGGRVLWLDSENSFKPWLVRGVAYRFGLDPEAALGNIRRAKMILASQITETFDTIPQICAEQNIKLVIIDSLTGLFRAEYVGLEALRIRQQDLNVLLNHMRRTAAATGTIFLYTNQVMASISTYGGNPNTPAGGHILSHGSDYRFYTRRKKDDIRIFQLQDNAGIPEFSVELKLGWGGFYADKSEKSSTEPDVREYLQSIGWGGASGEVEDGHEEAGVVEAGE